MSLNHCAGSLKDKLGLTLEIAAHFIFQPLTVGQVNLDA
jgi:cytochrome bd-type quinol oxidase subunit 1